MSSKDRQVSRKLAEAVKERDKYCINCGSPYNLDVAHYIGKGRGGLGIKENLALLCRTCHHAFDNGNNDEQYKVIKERFRYHLECLYPTTTDAERTQQNKWDIKER